ncbi:hypothetical protein [Alkalihalobacillus pseudalcaliphilus]|uniref:hypothetical protein n=1 Tax=Alkalihalobacillus pseudalcaliphilus TaxID=79884 RepID=UPI00064E0D56|nr:hypothetical protein [Alkalihalobacillus pseudalcaliphilus]KMK76044.1 hypothetical protein AB990_12495 [Alkalihalobacillus pseudalcaliphilus]
MNVKIFEYRTILACSIDEAWSFFSTPSNIKFITKFPPIVDVSESRQGDLAIHFGYSFYSYEWHATLKNNPECYSFTDIAVKPPYPFTFWRHDHRFETFQSRTVMVDTMTVESKWPSMFLRFFFNRMFRSREKQMKKIQLAY